MRTFSVEQIAEVCHEANRALTKCIGDAPAPPPWSDAPQEVRESSIHGVRNAIDNPRLSAVELHAAWVRGRLASGWRYGPVMDEAKKEHPAIVEALR